jgi:molybdopterin-guanine dinucleotide biosynthesis protein A
MLLKVKCAGFMFRMGGGGGDKFMQNFGGKSVIKYRLGKLGGVISISLNCILNIWNV